MRQRWSIDLVVLAALVFALYQLYGWREAGLEGYGLDLYRIRDKVATPLGRSSEIALRGQAPGDYEWRGRIVAPRCGRYRFFAYGGGELVMELDGREIAAAIPPTGPAAPFAVREAWTTAGSHALRLRYRSWVGQPARLRLMWSPGDFDGTPQPIATSLLAVESGKQAAAGRRPRPYALAPRDSQAGALALGALALALLLWWRRPLVAFARQLGRDAWARQDLAVSVGIFALALLLRLWGGDGGSSLPGEGSLLAAARSSVQLLLAGDVSPLSWQWSRGAPLGPALIYAPAALFYDALGAGRALSALFGALGAALLFVAGRELAGRGVAVLAGLLVASLPSLIATGREVSVIGPAALCYLITLWLFWRGCRLWREALRQGLAGEHQAQSVLSARRAFWGAGWAFGVTLALQLTALSALAVMVAVFLAIFGARLWRRGALRFPGALVLLPGLAIGAALLLQPGLWARPLSGLAEQILVAGEGGVALGSMEAPSWLASRAPSWLWALALLGALRALGLLLPHDSTPEAVWRRRVGGALAVLWLLAPTIAAALVGWGGGGASAVSQMVLPALLALCLLAALGIEALARGAARLIRRDDLRFALLGLAGGAALLLLFVGTIRFHPNLAAYDGGWGLGYDALRGAHGQRAALGSLEAALGYVARAARSGESVALDFDGQDRAAACARPAEGRVLRRRADVKLVAWKAPGKEPSWLISAKLRHAPAGYRLAKALRAGDRVLLRIFRRGGAEAEL